MKRSKRLAKIKKPWHTCIAVDGETCGYTRNDVFKVLIKIHDDVFERQWWKTSEWGQVCWFYTDKPAALDKLYYRIDWAQP